MAIQSITTKLWPKPFRFAITSKIHEKNQNNHIFFSNFFFNYEMQEATATNPDMIVEKIEIQQQPK